MTAFRNDVPPSRIITKLEYMNLFTDLELINIYTAAKTTVEIEIWLDKFKLATEIDKDVPAVKNGLLSMVALNLLEVDRVNEILK